MRKTTIFRSDRITLSVAGALLLAAPLRSQEPVQAGEQRPRVHVVQSGETLWALADRYYGDPFLWPEIYRLNTLVVEDPHWIFPGEHLVLAPLDVAFREPVEPGDPEPTPVPGIPGDTTRFPVTQPFEAPQIDAPAPPPPPPPADPTAATIFAGSRRGGVRLHDPYGGEAYRYRPVRRGQFYAAGFLTEGASIPWARVMGGARQTVTERRAATSSVPIYEEVEIRAPHGAAYQVGDSLLVANLARQVPGWGRVVVPSGIVTVTHVSGEQVLARVVSQFGRVVDGQVAMPLEAFRDPGYVLPSLVSNGMEAEVITLRDVPAVPGQQDIVFVNRGREDGVVLGDVFEILELSPPADAPPASSAVIQIVHLRERSASGLITQISLPGIRPGQPVRLIRKMPS